MENREQKGHKKHPWWSFVSLVLREFIKPSVGLILVGYFILLYLTGLLSEEGHAELPGLIIIGLLLVLALSIETVWRRYRNTPSGE